MKMRPKVSRNEWLLEKGKLEIENTGFLEIYSYSSHSRKVEVLNTGEASPGKVIPSGTCVKPIDVDGSWPTLTAQDFTIPELNKTSTLILVEDEKIKFVISMEVIQDAINGHGEVIGCTETRLGSIAAVRFNKPVSMKYPGRGKVNLNGYAGGIGYDDQFPINATLRGNSYEGYFVGKDKRTFVFGFMFFFGDDKLEKKFYLQTYEEAEQQVLNSLKSFFRNIDESGINVWQHNKFSVKDFGDADINYELSRMADFWYGKCVMML